MAFLHALLRQWLPPEGRVLEIGRGSGRDAWFMASQLGLDVLATDGSEKLIALAAQQQVPPDGKQTLFEAFGLSL